MKECWCDRSWTETEKVSGSLQKLETRRESKGETAMQVAEWKDSDKRVEDDRALQEVNGCNGAVGERSYCTCRDRTFSLQDAFAKFRKRRIAEKKKALTARAEISAVRGTEEFRRELRRLFCEQCLRYVGTPYGQRYHSETDCECEGCTQSGRQLFHSDLFLDCCGLVRRAVADLQEYFGFRLGPGNQVYQLDTLPIRKESIHELQPGDLVFYYGAFRPFFSDIELVYAKLDSLLRC